MATFKTFKFSFAKATDNAAIIEKKEVSFATTPAFLYMQANGIEYTDYVTLDQSFSRQDNPEFQRLLDNMLENNMYVEELGKTYELFGAGASGFRTATMGWAVRSTKDRLINWWRCGMDLSAMPANKLSKYLFLMFSSVKRWEDAIGTECPVPVPSIKKTAVFKSAGNHTCEGKYLRVNTDSCAKNVTIENPVTDFLDGPCIILIDDSDFDDKKRQLYIEKREAVSIRYPFMKGCATFMLKSYVKKLFEDRGWNTVVEDYYGDMIDILSLDMIVFDTVFKAAKYLKVKNNKEASIENWKSFQTISEEYGHKVFISVTAHNRLADMPYQQHQTLDPDFMQESAILELGKDIMYKAQTANGAAKLIGGDVGKAADLLPQLLNHWYVAQLTQSAYANRRRLICGGKIPKIVRNLFAWPDAVAAMEHIAGAKIEGVLPTRTVSSRLYTDGADLDVTRCPHLDHAHCIRRNLLIEKQYAGLFLGNSIFVNVHDQTMIVLQLDYDGDHLTVTDNKEIIAAARRGFKKWNNVPLLYAALDSKLKQGSGSYDQDLKDLVRLMEAAPVGLFATNLNIVINSGLALQNREYIPYLTRKANVVIDEGTHGKDDSTVADNAVGIVESLKKVKYPMFYGYAKGRIDNDGKSVVFNPVKRGYQMYDSPIERYSDAISEEFDEEIHIVDKPATDWTDIHDDTWKMMVNHAYPVKTIAGLCSDGDGLFNSIANRRADEYKIGANETAKTEIDNMIKEMATKELRDFAAQKGVTMSEIVNYLVRKFYHDRTRQNNFMPQLHRTFWMLFGDVVLDNIRRNMTEAGMKVPVEVEEEFEESFEEPSFEPWCADDASDCGFYMD